MPFKHHSKRRHHIPRQSRRVTNWRDYDAALRNRGSSTIWFSEEVMEAWRAQFRKTPGRQPHHSGFAIETALALRAVSQLTLCQTEALIGSIMQLLQIALLALDHSTLRHRACAPLVQRQPCCRTGEPISIVDSTGLKLHGADDWLFEKHGISKRRPWRKLHIGADADSDQIVAFALTDRQAYDASHVEPSREQSDHAPASFKGDDAFDRSHVLEVDPNASRAAKVHVSPTKEAVRGSVATSAGSETHCVHVNRHVTLASSKLPSTHSTKYWNSGGLSAYARYSSVRDAVCVN